MKILFFGNKNRGIASLSALRDAGHDVVGIIAHATASNSFPDGSFSAVASSTGIPLFLPKDPNLPSFVEEMRALTPDILVMAGYGPILQAPLLSIAPRGCINLHGGKLPERRGSSPMNWALIDGDPTFTLSVIRADTGVDTGSVLIERTFPAGPDDTIADLQQRADDEFPEMLIEALAGLESGSLTARTQDDARAAYYPLRFPDDGLILWDTLTALEIHNRVRALTSPFPGAFSFWKGRRVTLVASSLSKRDHRGEPGRIYIKNEKGLLICASDRCLWISRAHFDDDGSDAIPVIPRYDRLTTVREAVMAWASQKPPT